MPKAQSFYPNFGYAVRKNFLLQIGLAFSSGLVMALAPAPLNAFPLAWVALSPLWFLLLNQDRQPRCRSFMLLAIAWGMAYHGSSLSWITGLHPLTWLGVPWLASITVTLFCWLFITLWGAGLVAVWAGVMTAIEKLATSAAPTVHSRHKALAIGQRVLLGTALWCGLEWIWSLTPLYWTSLSLTQSPGNLAILHLGQLSGPTVVTAAIVAVNGLLAEAWMSTQRSVMDMPLDISLDISLAPRTSTRPFPAALLSSQRPQTILCLGVAIALLTISHLTGYGLSRLPLADSETASLKVGIVQGNIPTRIKLSSEGLRRAIYRYTAGYKALTEEGVEAVLTPEGALPMLWDDRTKSGNPFYQAVVDRNRVAWLGIFVREDHRITQSLLTLLGNGDPLSRYNKVKLVPLGEYIPFQEVLGAVINRLSPIRADMLPGSPHQRFQTPFGMAIASICYESAFPQFFREQAAAGGQFILTASNLDPYSAVLKAQHQAQDLMRAIEVDRWAVRATNTGYSGIIDPHGKIVWRSQPNTYEIHADTIYRRQTTTLYVRWGDWLTPLLAGLGIVATVFRLRQV